MTIENRSALASGQILVARYKGKTHKLTIVDGEDGSLAFKLGSKVYASPSGAGKAVMNGVACNGWRFWSLDGQEPAAKTAAKAAPKPKTARKPKPAKRAMAETRADAPAPCAITNPELLATVMLPETEAAS